MRKTPTDRRSRPPITTASHVYLSAPLLALDLPDLFRSSWEIWLAFGVVLAAAAMLRRQYAGRRERQRRNLETAQAAAVEALSASDRESALQPIVAALPALVRATNAQILLVDTAEQHLAYVVAARGRPRGAVSMSTISGPVTCFRARETTVVEDAQNCPFISKEWVAKRRLKSALYVPILSGASCIGVIEIEDRARKRRFDAEELSVAEHLARIAELSLRLCDQRTMTEQLHRSEKLASVSELASAMSAELGELFSQATQLLQGGPLSREQTRMAAEQVSRAEEALERLVRFATPSSAEKQDVDLNALLRRVAAEYKKTDDRGQIKLNLGERAPVVSADPSHLEQLFQILFRHARHFVNRLEGRSLQVHTAIRDTMGVVSIAPLSSADHAVRKTLAQMPDAGATPTMGFSICQALIERAGGSLQMDPASSLGFRIDLEYPLVRNKDASVEQQSLLRRTPTGIRSGPTTALVVEPDEGARRLIVHQLAEQSVRAIPAATAEEAEAISRRIQFDWVFCELSLHNGSGVELYEAVRRGIEKFVFIADEAACSANPEAFQAPDKAVLKKPVKAAAVEALIEELQGGPVVQDA